MSPFENTIQHPDSVVHIICCKWSETTESGGCTDLNTLVENGSTVLVGTTCTKELAYLKCDGALSAHQLPVAKKNSVMY